MKEKRSADHAKALKRALIVFDHGHSTVNCTIGNLSASGALLRVASVVGIPPTFVLVGSDGVGQHCQIVWTSATELGVIFAPTDVKSPPGARPGTGGPPTR